MSPIPLRLSLAIFASSLLCAASGCSVERYAINKLGDALAASSTSFASDEDPELVRQAVPFSLKLIESVLAESPKHEGLLLAATKGFTQYSFAFVQQDAEARETVDVHAAQVLALRARKLYLRARDYGLRGLDVRHAGFSQRLRADPNAAADLLSRSDVPFAYWTAAAWGAALALGKDSPALLADQPLVEALIDRALVLDESYGDGAIHSFLIVYEASRPGGQRDAEPRARAHFARAVELEHGQLAGPYLALAEGVSLAKQDKREFVELLGQALAIDPDARPDSRLENLVYQARARWLLERVGELFLE
jgi:predicted anti-sigma-YlaC factor YlaD